MNNDLEYKIALTFLPNIGPVLARNLISYCGSAEAVFKSKRKHLVSIPGIGSSHAKTIVERRVFDEVDKELRHIEDNSIKPLFYLDDDYPNRLKNYDDSPVMLYYRGNADLNYRRMVSIVGTRKPTERGISFCQKLVGGLKHYDVSIVSGLAYGIDICAHKQCLELEIPTIGVMGSGLKIVYPSLHRRAAMRMLAGGGLLTEYAFNKGPEKVHFPMRNRIIAGMCDALIVIETGRKGGSIISAQIANGYMKDVFAVPGRPEDKQSIGCNHLIKSNQASLLGGIEDIGYIMGWDVEDDEKPVQASLFLNLKENEQAVMNVLTGSENLPIDELSLKSKLNLGELSSILLNLEFMGLVKSLPGKVYTSAN